MSDHSFVEFVLDQLGPLSGLESRRMFGGTGFYAEGSFFALVFAGRLYFKTNDRTRAEYTRLGMSPFRPNEEQTLKSYYEVPLDILEDPQSLVQWARRALAS